MGVRKISLVAMMVALIMVLTGCIQMEVGVELNKDGSGGMEILMAQNTDLLEEELDPEAEAETDSLTFFQDEDFEGMEGVTTTTEAVEYMDKGYNFAGEKAIIEIEDMESFIAQMNEKEGEDGIRLVDLENGNKRFEMTVELGDENLEGQETTQDDAQVWAMLESTGMKILYSITTDYEVVSHNAHIVDGDKYSLDLLRLSRELENTDEDSMIFFVEIETESTTEPEEEVEQDDEESKGSREEVESRLKAAIQLDRNHQDFYGEALKELGILKGTEKGLELNKGLTRAEGAVMYSRLLGLEEEIELFASENPDYTTDFTDVPDWVKPTINYLHSNFMKETEYATLVLRALGYKDGEDFEWNTANVRAEELGLFSEDAVEPSVMLGGEFNRRKMAYISYNALFSVDADGIELIERLEEE
jgi:hypothetical protein